ncbi:Ger(x)C family spore germination protein [Sporolactobacillus kofuensis]|uniref:Ger(X)C family spore germination protein n=1 Tax=Sporolactobacillus kofuensis TaxID=269672 RepID=A0ABW1WCY3_9BACL|nr:Ger(x)C family spore germination protein [Sporolactobacillus kofuensis]MCO7175887.1 Ger(x)C family spore germination protein [Sporolactobacillus kofuensis]
MKRKITLTSLFLCFIFLAGCIPTSIIDDILIIEGEGYDYIGNGKVIGTITMPNFVQSGNQGSQGAGMPTTASMIRNLSGKTYDGKSLVDKFQSEGQRVIRPGKIRLILYNKRLAKHGLAKQLTFRNRDPDVPRDLNLAIVDGSCKELLTSENYQTQIPIARYVQDMIIHNNEQNYPDSDLSTFLYAYYGTYMDPFMPIIRKKDDHIEMRGLALFKRDKYVMSISENKAFIFKMLYQNFNQGVYDFQFAPGKHIALRNVHTSVSYNVRNGNSTSPEIFAKVKIIGQVRQAYPGSISKATAPRMERKLERDLAYQAKKLVHQLQKKGIDPLQLGDQVRSFTYHFDGKSWPERYRQAHFHCKISVKIQQTGISS